MSRAAGPDGFVSSAVWPTRSAAAYSVRLRMAAVSTGCGKAASASRTSAASRVPEKQAIDDEARIHRLEDRAFLWAAHRSRIRMDTPIFSVQTILGKIAA